MVIDKPTPIPDSPLAAIPDPLQLRWVIGMRYAEILVLKKLLRVVESRDRLFQSKAESDERQEVTGA